MADHDRQMSLQEVEPSPVEETPTASKEGYFPESKPSTARANALGLSQHSVVWYLSRIQRYSSYVFTAFGVAHIANTSLIPLITKSVPASESYLLLTRPYYHGIPAEPFLIIAPVWAHVLSGLGLRVYRWYQSATRYGDKEASGIKSFFHAKYWPPLSVISKSGVQFIPLLVGHAFINRVVPQKFPGGSSNVNLGYVSHAFAKHPVISYAGFAALLAVGCFHITWGWSKWLGLTPDQTTTLSDERVLVKKRRWYTVAGLTAALTTLWMAGSFGIIARGGAAPGWVGRQYDEMYHSIPLIGRWL